MMNYIINKILGGVLYKDSEIICIKRDKQFLDVYQFYPCYKKLLTLELLKGTNNVGKYENGIYYFQDKKTYFHSFNGIVDEIKDGRFYYKINSQFSAYVSLEESDKIIFKSDKIIEIPILQNGGQKLFTNYGVVQAGDSRYNTGLIVFNSFESRGVTWKHDFSDLINSEKAYLSSKILELSDKIYFTVSGDEQGALFCLDAHSGKVLYKHNGFGFSIFKDNNFIYTTKFENILCKVNVITNEIEEWDVNILIKENGFDSIHDHRCAVKNDCFYFTQTLGDNKSKVGVLDMNSKNLVFKHEFIPENGGIGSIHVNANRIYIQTQDNTLHIFEKEENNIVV